MSNDTTETETTVTLKDRINARVQTTKNFVGRHKTTLTIGAITIPVTLWLAKKAADGNECCGALDELAELLEDTELDTDDADTVTIEG